MNEITKVIIRGIIAELYDEVIGNQFMVDMPWNSNDVRNVVETEIILQKFKKYEEMLKE